MKTNTALTIAFLIAAGALSSACDSKEEFESAIKTDRRVTLSTGVAEYRIAQNRVDFVAVSENGLSSRALFEIGDAEGLVDMFGGPEATSPSLLFITTLPDSGRQNLSGPGLAVINPETERVDRYNTASYFGRVAFSPDGRFAILYHADDDTERTMGLYNPNEVALLDLDSPPSDTNPSNHSMDLSGDVLHDIIFLGIVEIDGAERNLAAFITDGRIKLVDIEDPAFSSVTVTLKTESDYRTILISKIITRPPRENRDTTLFAMATGISEIFEIPLIATTDGFTAPSLNQQDGGPYPTDMAVVTDDRIELLVVTNGAYNQVNVVTVDSGDINKVYLDDGPKRIFSRGSDNGEELVLYGDDLRSIIFCDVTRLNEDQEDAFEPLTIQGGVADSSPLDENRMVLYPLDMYGLMILDLSDRAVTHLSSSYSYNWMNATLYNDIYFLPQPDGLVWLDLDTGHPDLTVFDDLVTEFNFFPEKGLGVALHPTVTGRATLFPLHKPTREAAFVSDGYLLEGVMNGEVTK